MTLAFTCLLPVCAGDDPAAFRAAAASILQPPCAPFATLICQDGPLPDPLAREVATAVHGLRAERIQNPGPRGLHHNLNHAIPRVRTPWIARCDADDINLPGRFADQVRHLADRPEISVLGGDLIEFWPDGRERRKTMPTSHEAIVAWARWRSPVNHNTVFIRADALRACGGYPAVPNKEDYALWLRLIGQGARFANLGRPLVRARLGQDFHRRRAGLANLASEWSLYQIRRRVPGLGGVGAAAALLARSGVLAMSGPTRLAYALALRR